MGLQREVVVEQGKNLTVDLEITKKKYAKKKGWAMYIISDIYVGILLALAGFLVSHASRER